MLTYIIGKKKKALLMSELLIEQNTCQGTFHYSTLNSLQYLFRNKLLLPSRAN